MNVEGDWDIFIALYVLYINVRYFFNSHQSDEKEMLSKADCRTSTRVLDGRSLRTYNFV